MSLQGETRVPGEPPGGWDTQVPGTGFGEVAGGTPSLEKSSREEDLQRRGELDLLGDSVGPGSKQSQGPRPSGLR